MSAINDLLFAIAPEFATTDAAALNRIDVLVSLAGTFVAPNQYGTKTDAATAYLVAHMLKLGDLGGTGSVTMEKIGDIQRSFAAGSKDNSLWGLGLTPYGVMYQGITRLTGRVAFVTGCIPPGAF